MGGLSSRIARRSKVSVLLEADAAKMFFKQCLPQRLKTGRRFIRGTIIHNNDLQISRTVFRQAGKTLACQFPVVEHGNDDRIKEYIFDNEDVTKNAEGKKYLRFITDTLKPWIDKNYRTKKDRENTGIGGSSLGGLISIYGGFLYPEVYSKLLIFSPSLWVEPENDFPMINFTNPYKIKVYLYGGRLEGSRMVGRIRLFEKALKKLTAQKSFDFEVRTNISDKGTHQEFFWSQEFPRAVEWLYIDSLESPVKAKNELENQTND